MSLAMLEALSWLAVAATIALLTLYEFRFAIRSRRPTERVARQAHETLREEWFATVSTTPGTEVLAVQTLRNSLMSASVTASTAVLGLMGAVTLSAPLFRESLMDGSMPLFTPRLALELVLLVLLLSSLISSAMAVRYYTHAGFIGAMPVGSASRERWSATGGLYVRRAGVLYGRGLRNLILLSPVLTGIVYPLAGPVAALLVVRGLQRFDRFSKQTRNKHHP
ncbi:uncharacterized protein DUF599 [Paraperlucidibaca baekdonensis]|uniref:Uncharacterized protein DUF599 n=1 Tax=Paraperlucidibaca baekdonensis TaxID=748120 RepID=A0A3E0H6P3_9GAMM|nr:DUF599 domain-containing protein [Paraperlucidibaca baekdonensis]REH39045.1 uncharacterized protein DUF599 [Paraperlucidibaca baekdonensis]